MHLSSLMLVVEDALAINEILALEECVPKYSLSLIGEFECTDMTAIPLGRVLD